MADEVVETMGAKFKRLQEAAIDPHGTGLSALRDLYDLAHDPAFAEYVLGLEREKEAASIIRVAAEFDAADGLFWRTNESGVLECYVNCNDVFAWACADAEPLTSATLPVFRKAHEDCRAACKFGEIWGGMLYCARVRGERPQGACYPEERELWPLFDACGPEREVGPGNPYAPGQRGSKGRPSYDEIAAQLAAANAEIERLKALREESVRLNAEAGVTICKQLTEIDRLRGELIAKRESKQDHPHAP